MYSINLNGKRLLFSWYSDKKYLYLSMSNLNRNIVMEQLFYIPKHKITERLDDLHIDGYHIVVDGSSYERLRKRPPNRRVFQRLRSIDEMTQITIYS